MIEEVALGKVYDGRLMRRLLSYLTPYGAVVVLSLTLVIMISALKLVGPMLVKVAIDEFIANDDVLGLYRLSWVYIGVLIGQFGVSYWQIYMMNMVGQRVMADMRLEIFTHLQRLQLAFSDRNPIGRMVTRVTTDVETLNELFSSGVVTIFGDVFMLLGIMAVLLYLDWRLAIVTFAVLPVLFGVTLIFKRRVRVVYRQVRTRVAMLNAFIQENIIGMRVVQLFGQERRKLNQYSELNQKHTDANLESILHYSIFYPVVEILSAIAIALIIWYGGGQILLGTLTLGGLVAFIQYSEKFFRPISDLSEKFNVLQGAMASSERIFSLLDTKVTIQSPQKVVPDPFLKVDREGSPVIRFKDVWFAYDDEKWVLRDVNFSVNHGETVAIVGHTGSGKSTLMSLLARFYDTQHGQVEVGGVDVRQWNLKELRKQFGVVLQDVYLFSGTIASNIRLGDEDLADEQVVASARSVNLENRLSNLRKGLDAPVLERGSSLSLGQRQLVSFARALVRDPKILLLDEATSNIDTDTELLIQEALEKLFTNRTSIVIAHRLSTIQKADRILVLHKGSIREFGTHQELLATRGIYYKLYQLQYKEQEFGVSL